ncbi:F0F1 ATP synthase subunit gamma [Thermatribacter velox]|uniref:F0F1 ATP synthase subunit gamma n=1 Tax=Thermatribacter velox TaxID=3039681 RepID=A0ABZ2YDI9_9BACT
MTRLSDIKRKIDLVKDIEHLTRTMKTISAIRWRMGRSLLQPAVDFRLKLELALELVVLHLEASTLFSERKLALLGIFSDRGLVGGFNQSIARQMLKFAQETQSPSREIQLLVLGKQGRNHLMNQGYPIAFSQPLNIVRIPGYKQIRELSYQIKNFLFQESFDALYLFYNTYLSVTQYQPTQKRIHPFYPQSQYLPQDTKTTSKSDFEIFANPEALYRSLQEKYFSACLYEAVIQSFMSEQATRLRLMDSATTHSRETLETLGLLYHKRRQEKITRELSEVISASIVEGAM